MDIIKVEMRNTEKKAKQLRRMGIIPGSIHLALGSESISIQLSLAAAEQIFRSLRVGSTLMLELDGRKIPVQIKEKKKNCLGNQIENLTFEELHADVEVNSVAHILLKNAEIVSAQLEQQLYEVPFASLPGDLVDTVTIDLTGLPEGTVLTVADLPELNKEQIKLKIDPETIVLRIGGKNAAAAPAAAPEEA